MHSSVGNPEKAPAGAWCGVVVGVHGYEQPRPGPGYGVGEALQWAGSGLTAGSGALGGHAAAQGSEGTAFPVLPAVLGGGAQRLGAAAC